MPKGSKKVNPFIMNISFNGYILQPIRRKLSKFISDFFRSGWKCSTQTAFVKSGFYTTSRLIYTIQFFIHQCLSIHAGSTGKSGCRVICRIMSNISLCWFISRTPEGIRCKKWMKLHRIILDTDNFARIWLCPHSSYYNPVLSLLRIFLLVISRAMWCDEFFAQNSPDNCHFLH